MAPNRLHYVADPMCSWCFGFEPELERLGRELPSECELSLVMGGLAPDSETPMPEETRSYIQRQWRAVTERTGVTFNWDFWERCEPRRSTYPACRAVLAAGRLESGGGWRMFRAIQRAYYREARNPSLASTLVELAEELGIDAERFASDLVSDEIQERLERDFVERARLGAAGFPSLFLEDERGVHGLMRGHARADEILSRLGAITGGM